MGKRIELIPGNYAFIDSNNLYIAVREQGWKLDFERFRKYLSDKYQVTKAFLFIGFLATNESLYTQLQEQGYVLVFKPTLVLADGRVKGNVDAELVLHVMIEYPNYHNAVIVTGDGDYFCLLDYLRKQQKLLKLIIPDRNRYSSLLRKFAAGMVFMNDLKAKLEYRVRE
ncbi:MAG: NYN domain-containing protein [Sedimentisphaerales bacterium]|nr:NYN domain-containing protein [Sedimentisphaerales bacterium]